MKQIFKWKDVLLITGIYYPHFKNSLIKLSPLIGLAYHLTIPFLSQESSFLKLIIHFTWQLVHAIIPQIQIGLVLLKIKFRLCGLDIKDFIWLRIILTLL
jgi:hypothetical protein